MKKQTNQPKRGFYTQRFHSREMQDLSRVETSSLQDEIEMLRIVTRQAAEMKGADMSTKELLEYYRMLSEMCRSISVLMRAEKKLKDNPDPRQVLMDTIGQALRTLHPDDPLFQETPASDSDSRDMGGYKPLDFHSPISPELNLEEEE